MLETMQMEAFWRDIQQLTDVAPQSFDIPQTPGEEYSYVFPFSIVYRDIHRKA